MPTVPLGYCTDAAKPLFCRKESGNEASSNHRDAYIWTLLTTTVIRRWYDGGVGSLVYPVQSLWLCRSLTCQQCPWVTVLMLLVSVCLLQERVWEQGYCLYMTTVIRRWYDGGVGDHHTLWYTQCSHYDRAEGHLFIEQRLREIKTCKYWL